MKYPELMTHQELIEIFSKKKKKKKRQTKSLLFGHILKQYHPMLIMIYGRSRTAQLACYFIWAQNMVCLG
jgi:hypothetical protein